MKKLIIILFIFIIGISFSKNTSFNNDDIMYQSKSYREDLLEGIMSFSETIPVDSLYIPDFIKD